MKKFFNNLADLVSFIQLPKNQRRIVFYSEGKTYWVHLEGLLKSFLQISDIPVCYISSGLDDPGLQYSHPNLKVFRTDEGSIRNWLFENIDTELLIMTMPDLDQYQVKRSKHKVHYVYTQHSLVSFHMVYRKGAFDAFDTVFCAGPHHITETREIERVFNLPEKNLVEHGYARLDSILEEAQSQKKESSDSKHVLIAPSWGENSLIEVVGMEIVSELLKYGFRVTLRPHPQTIKFKPNIVNNIVQAHKNNALFDFETNVATQQTLHESDLMIGDWSGAALDFAFGLKKPVLFVDVPRKVNNPEYTRIKITPFEESIRELIGKVLSTEECNKIASVAEKMINSNKLKIQIESLANESVFNLGNSNAVGAAWLLQFLETNK